MFPQDDENKKKQWDVSDKLVDEESVPIRMAPWNWAHWAPPGPSRRSFDPKNGGEWNRMNESQATAGPGDVN